MEVLAGLKSKDNIEGTILVNDETVPSDFYQQIGYVTQVIFKFKHTNIILE